VGGVEDLVVGHAESHAGVGRRVDELLAFAEAGRQRLFHQHVPPGPDRRQGHREMQVVRQIGFDAHLTQPIGCHNIAINQLLLTGGAHGLS
jgi:hypothetical protein